MPADPSSLTLARDDRVMRYTTCVEGVLACDCAHKRRSSRIAVGVRDLLFNEQRVRGWTAPCGRGSGPM